MGKKLSPIIGRYSTELGQLQNIPRDMFKGGFVSGGGRMMSVQHPGKDGIGSDVGYFEKVSWYKALWKRMTR